MTTTDLTGIQVAALHGLLQNQGMGAPDITELHDQYQTLAAVGPYYGVIDNLSNIPTATQIGSYTGNLPDWDSLTEYDSGDKVVYSAAVYQAITTTTIGETPTGVIGETEWVQITDPADRTHSISYTVTLPSWIRSNMLQIAGSAGSFVSGFSQVLSNTVISSSTTVAVNLLNHNVIRTFAEDFPALVGSVPQQFISNWGNGLLIPKAHARTAAMFPGGQGSRLFASILGQAQAYAQNTRSIYTSAAQSTFGSDSSAVSGAMGGVDKLAGNNPADLQAVGACMFQSAALINLQQPWVSYSAAHVLKYIADRNALYVGNLSTKVFNKTFVDPVTQRPQLIISVFLDQLIANSTAQTPLYQTAVDRALADFVNQALDSTDVQQIAQFMQVLTAAPIRSFAQLLNPDTQWQSTQNILKIHTGQTGVVQAIISAVTRHMRIGTSATAAELGSVLTQMQPVSGAALSQLTVPTTPAQFQTLLNLLGTGSGENGSMRCEDCVGQTNYNEVLQFTIAVLSPYHTAQGANEFLRPAVSAVTALQEASELGNFEDITQSDWTEYDDWAELIIDIKNTVDPIAQQIGIQVEQSGLSLMLMPYNRLAETHNTSHFVYTAAPIYQDVPTGINPVINFIKQLANYGLNADQFDSQQIIEDCCVADSVTGQAVIAVMREAVNINALSSADLGSDANSLNSTPVPVPPTGLGLVGGGAWPA
jgi:uncharacterized protein YerC